VKILTEATAIKQANRAEEIYQFRFLSQNDMPDVYQTFVEAYSDYAVDMSYNTETAFAKRAVKNGVELGFSVGIYDNGKMVGFTLVGLDDWLGVRCAFDAMTGIVKPHRGQGLAGKMFDYMIPALKRAGVKEFRLEVLQSNTPAIKAYHKTGFSIVRNLDCFALKLENINCSRPLADKIKIQAIARDDLPLYAAFLDWQPSWENSWASIGRIADEVVLWEARYQGERAGLLVYYPTLKWIMGLAVAKPYRRRGIATALLFHLKKYLGDSASIIKMISVEHADRGMGQFLKKAGFEIYTRQYEMRMDL
jgi:ribosomal protein S18 acetylase RimI-like enzyme